MESNRPKLEDLRAGCVPHEGRGLREGQQHVSAGPGQPQLTICQASGDGPHASTSPRSTPAANDVAETLLPLRHPCPSAPVQVQERLDPRISIRQRILCEQLGILNQDFKSSWMQAYAELKGEISDLHQDFVDHFSNLMKLTTTDAEREDLRLIMATGREQVFSDMKARIQASCVDFRVCRWHQLSNRLQTARMELIDDGNCDVLVAVLDNQVYRSDYNFQKRAIECAHAVWDEFVKYLGLEKDFLPA